MKEIRNQKSEIRKQKTENRKQKQNCRKEIQGERVRSHGGVDLDKIKQCRHDARPLTNQILRFGQRGLFSLKKLTFSTVLIEFSSGVS